MRGRLRVVHMATEAPHRVVVAGGGVAGLEAAMTLHALAGPLVEITLVAADEEFTYRPLSVGEPFGLVPPVRYPLRTIADDFGLALVHARLESVDVDAHRLGLGRGDGLEYDSLLVALGARGYPAWDHVTTFGGSPDVDRTADVLHRVERGELASVAFVVPRGVTWPLPVYELALMTADAARRAGSTPEVAVFTPESDPLAVFGREASAEVRAVLDAAGVSLACGVTVDVTLGNDLVIPGEETPLQFEHVIAAPLLRGPAVAGLPSDARGFLPIDEHGRIRGVDDVYAAGDGADFSVKQGGVAAQQAVAAAEVIASRAGADVQPRPIHPVLRARLLTGAGSRFLRAEAPALGSGGSRASERPLWWPSHKIAAVHLAGYLAQKGVLPEPLTFDARELEDERLVAIGDWTEESPYGA